MGKIPFDPKSVTSENPDVRRMLAVLESGGRYSGTVATCPVCGSENFSNRVVCQREYCVAVWNAVKKLFRNRAKPKIQTFTEALTAPLRAATREEWRERPFSANGCTPRFAPCIAARTGVALNPKPAPACRKGGAATEDCMTETLRPCDCGAHPRLYRIGQQSLLPWQSNEAFFVRCPICEKRTKGYELPDMAILRWNQRELLNKKRSKR